MTQTEIKMVVDSAMEVYPNLIVADIYWALHEKPWYKALTSLDVGARGYLNEARSISDEIYQAPSAAKGQVNTELVMERNHELEIQVRERTEAYFRLLRKYEKLEKEQNGGR